MPNQLPPPVAAHDILKRTLNASNYEGSELETLLDSVYGGKDMARSQAIMDAMPANTPQELGSVTAAQIFAVSAIKVVAHNVSIALLKDPALLANPSIQALIAAAQAAREDNAIPKAVVDTLPYNSTVNPDGSVTYSAFPE